MVFAILQEFGFGEIGVRFDLDYGGLDARGFVDGLEFVECDVGEADGSAFAVIDESFESFPGVEESCVGVVNYVAVFIARILIVAGLEGEGSVDEVEVEVVELEAREAGFEGGFDAVGRWLEFQSFVVTKMSSRAIVFALAAWPSCNAMPTSRSLP